MTGKQRLAERMRHQAAERRKALRRAAAEHWGDGDAQTRQRTAMTIAAFLLDERHESVLADWLISALPENARTVATGVAVHALRRGVPAVWDALAAVDAMDLRQASDWFLDDADFVWSPEPGMLAGAAESPQSAYPP